MLFDPEEHGVKKSKSKKKKVTKKLSTKQIDSALKQLGYEFQPPPSVIPGVAYMIRDTNGDLKWTGSILKKKENK